MITLTARDRRDAHATARGAAIILATALALVLRLCLAGGSGVRSAPAGVVFALALVAIAVAAGAGYPRVNARDLWWGLAGAALLCVAPFVLRMGRPGVILPFGAFTSWAWVVVLVAVAEEAVFRGVLFETVLARFGEPAALAVTTVGFALVHVPLYGWHAVLLDLAAGLLLGVLRTTTGSATAPAVAHAVADLAAWWLR